MHHLFVIGEQVMPWKEVTKMSSKLEFVKLASSKTAPFSHLCTRFGISRKTGYLLLNRYREEGLSGLEEKSKRPKNSPARTNVQLEEKVIGLRQRKRTWGGRKIRQWLLNQGEQDVPSASTITDILRRQGFISERESRQRKHYIRFEHESPNDLWQMDFKGHFEIGNGRCHPLTILDDHSRFSIGLKACDRETTPNVKNHLIDVFRNYGLPLRMNMDNGSPWATAKGNFRYTALSIWLIRIGVKVSFSRIRHPETNGKDERFHRTLKDELLQFNYFKTCREAQKYFDIWRDEYNCERPHEALNLEVPINRYQISNRPYPEQIPTIEYRERDIVRKVDAAGKIGFKGNSYFLSEALRGEYIALRETSENIFDVIFCNQKMGTVNKYIERGIG